jgi:hypothetical protein
MEESQRAAGALTEERGLLPATSRTPYPSSLRFGDCSLTTCFAGRPATELHPAANFSLGGGNANWGRREPPASARGVRRTKCDFRWISAVHTSLAVDRSADYSSATPVTDPSDQQPLRRPVGAKSFRTGWPQSLYLRACSRRTAGTAPAGACRRPVRAQSPFRDLRKDI